MTPAHKLAIAKFPYYDTFAPDGSLMLARLVAISQSTLPSSRPGLHTMPIYEYKCSTCENEFEKLTSILAPVPESCPACGVAGVISKKVSRTNFSLKGDGWAKDGYSSPKN